VISNSCRQQLRSFAGYLREHRSSSVFWLFGLLVCLLWTLGSAVWPGLRSIYGPHGSPEAATSTLTTLALISAAAIVLALTAALIGLQLLSRYGSRASRMVMDGPVGPLIVAAGLLGVGLPLTASVEPWHWLTILGFACFSWSLLTLAIAGFLTLWRLNPRWLTLRTIRRAFPLPATQTPRLFYRLGDVQATVLDIAAGIDETEQARWISFRAIALVGLARHRIDAANAGLPELFETLTARTRSATSAQMTSEEAASLLGLLALASDDSSLSLEVLKSLNELVQDAVQQHRVVVRPALLDDVSGLMIDQLRLLLAPVTLGWLTEEPARELSRRNPRFSGRPVLRPAEELTGASSVDGRDWRAISGWLDDATPPTRDDSPVLSALVPSYQGDDDGEPEAEAVDVVNVAISVATAENEDPDHRTPGETGHANDESSQTSETNDAEPVVEEVLKGLSAAARAAVRRQRRRQTDAYDVLEAGVALLVSACAAPTPEDASWPGGWRGVDALKGDIQRLASVGLSLYGLGRYPPSDQVERAIEALGVRIVGGRQPELQAYGLSDVTSWRLGELVLERTTAQAVTEALRQLAVEAWHAGFSRRALLTIRRLVAIFELAVKGGDTRLVEDLAGDLQRVLIHTAKSTDRSLAERERSRQLVLSLAPDFAAFGQVMRLQTDEELWRQAFAALDGAGWSAAGSEIEAAAETYLYFLAGIETEGAIYFGGPTDVVSWDRRPKCHPRELLPEVRVQLFHELEFEATASSPYLALMALFALWRDAQVCGHQGLLEVFCDALSEYVLKEGRRDFELAELWVPTEEVEDRPPRFGGPSIHWRVFDVALEAHQWASRKLAGGEEGPAVLPPVATPDADLRALLTGNGVENLVNQRRYWGIESDEECLVLVEEADGSRRLLRDCEGRARSQLTWGYFGTGPHNLSEALAADILGPLAYCPSCFGVIAASGGLVTCPSCGGDGLRSRDLRLLAQACYSVIPGLSKRPDPALRNSDGSPPGAQWRLSRIELLQRAVELADEFRAERSSDHASDNSA
jgi:hypothetical protein